MSTFELETHHGPARVHLRLTPDPRGALVLGHGAGGGVGAVDLKAAAEAAAAQRFAVALVEQPYRVAGRRSPAPAPHLDRGWVDVITSLTADQLAHVPLVVGGRSMGARVACRTAARVGAIGVICLAFPLLPPPRVAARTAPQSRLGELDAVPVPTLVVQGTRDRFGVPPGGEHRTVVEVAGDHSLRSDPSAVGEAVRGWLASLSG